MKPCDEWRDMLAGWCVLPFGGVDYCGGEFRTTGKAPSGGKWPVVKQIEKCPWVEAARKGWKIRMTR